MGRCWTVQQPLMRSWRHINTCVPFFNFYPCITINWPYLRACIHCSIHLQLLKKKFYQLPHSIAMAFAPPPPPKTALGYYRMLAPTASVRVSPLCLGAMNFGDAWYVLFNHLKNQNAHRMHVGWISWVNATRRRVSRFSIISTKPAAILLIPQIIIRKRSRSNGLENG